MRDTPEAIGCPETRAGLRKYLKHQVLPGRRRRLEDHLVHCPGCIREFVELRESYWMAGMGAHAGLLAAA